MKATEIKNDIYWMGALDPNLRVFDIIMYTPYGTTYNSYIIKGSEKTVIFETVKEKFFDEYIERLKSLNINIEEIDYIVVNHTEPDHAGSIAKLLNIAKNAKIVGSAAAIKFLKAITNIEFQHITVGEGDTLSLGNKTLQFISAPFLHWPDSIYTYIVEDSLLLTCDSFGSHYCNDEILNNKIANEQDYMEALKYYYDCIMSPFSSYVLKAIDKIKDLNINCICPGHGPVLSDNPMKIVDLYKEWSKPKNIFGSKKITLVYVSAYGYTKTMAEEIIKGINSKGNFQIESFDLTYSKQEDILTSIDLSEGILFGSPTINGDALKPIWDILTTMNPIVHGKRYAAAFGSYGWSGEAVKFLEDRFKQLKLKTIPGLRVNFKPSSSELKQCFDFGEGFASLVLGEEICTDKPTETVLKETELKQWKCVVCGLIVEAPNPPDLCPACGASKDKFIELIQDKVLFTSDKKENFLIIGNGIAGFKAAEAIRERNSVCNIELISSEKYMTYYRPQLSDIISKDIPSNEFYLENKEYYKKNNIKLTLDTLVVDISTSDKTITLIDGNKRNFDKLILANGSVAFMPDMPGLNKSGVQVLRSLDDALNLKANLTSTKKVAIIGGGVLGLEAADAMINMGIEVTVIEFSSRLLPNQLDEEGSKIFKALCEKSGVKIILSDSAVEITGDTKANGVKLASGQKVDADLILFSIGIRPNKTLISKTEIKTNKGILVNEKMQTSLKDVYACGDIAEYNSLVYGNWPAAQSMGTIAGANAVGDTAIFEGFINSIIFNGFDIDLFTVGSINSPDSLSIQIKDTNKNIYKSLFFKEEKIIGAILIGDSSKASAIIDAIDKGLSIKETLTAL